MSGDTTGRTAGDTDGHGTGPVGVNPVLAALLDLRSVIALLFGVYGIVLTVLGALDGPAELAKAGGIRINLWTGLAMLVLAAGFAGWVALRPPVRRAG